ncbi:glycosyltransferase family 4 protein [Actinokineospora sp. 24-640]
MRIAYLLTQDRGGPVDVTLRLAEALLGTGEADIRVYGPEPARPRPALAGRHEVVAVPAKSDVQAARRMRAAVRAWRPDVVHAQDRRAGLVSVGLGSVVHTYHGVPDDVAEPWFRGARDAKAPSAYTRTVLAADALVARSIRRTVVPAASMGRFLRTRLRVPAHKVTHVDNCVDLPAARPPAGPVRDLMFVGLLVERKGILNLLAALAEPGVLPPGATLTIVGDGPQRPAAERLAAQPSLAGRVRLLGFRPDAATLLLTADALVLPSSMEQQPLVVMEAMAAGKPVLATDTGGVADLLDVPGARRHLAAPGDHAGLVAGLRALFADPDPAATGAALARHAHERFGPAACAARHLDLYRALLRSPA